MYQVCNRECWLPHGSSHDWVLIHCPLPVGHRGLHADGYNYPCFDDKDAEWFKTQHDVYLALGWVE